MSNKVGDSYIMGKSLVEPKTFIVEEGNDSREIKYFDKAEIFQEILSVAREDSFLISDLDIDNIREEKDTKGNLIYMLVPVKQELAIEINYGGIWYIFTLKGLRGNEDSLIVRATANKETPSEVEDAEIILKYDYKDREWLKP